jgi:UDP:flavonoid glycosyltransferase YjiC (YdhE family)
MGTRGDTQPFISLALRLKGAGHSVLLCARPDFADLAAEYDSAFSPIGRPYKSFIINNTKAFETGNFFKIMIQGLKQSKFMFENRGEDAYRAAMNSDAIIYK